MRHEDILAKMTVEEKAAILSGSSEWSSRSILHLGIPSLFFADGPHGIRKQEGAGDHLGLNESLPATCFPTAATVACSWDEDLGEEVGQALGREAASQGVDVLLGPGLNIKRSPLCGRNFEYFSEDPYLSGKMAAAYVRGIQSQGVSSCIKHFAVNSQELRRMAMNAVIDERTLREIYLTGFEIALLEGGAKAIMTSYNEVNGVYANENEHLLKEVLRKEWGFEGLVVTDWGASNDHVRAVKCRSNMEMPTPGFDSARELLAALENGELSMEELDACVDDVLEAALRAGENKKSSPKSFDKEADHKLAEKAARESIVLLKNDSCAEPTSQHQTAGTAAPLLPLREGCKVALVGDFARNSRYQGAGSSMVKATALDSMKQKIREYPLEYIGYAQGYLRNGEKNDALMEEALSLAKQAEVVIYCFGLDEMSESEGIDRLHMRIPQNQIDLLQALSQANSSVAGILSGGSAIEMPWHGCCKALLHGYLGGQAGAGAMLDVLTGRYNPSGKLAETFPIRYEDTPAWEYCPGGQRDSWYKESIFVGYRYYDTASVDVRYPFGYGLSYTEFAYSDLRIGEEGITFTLANVGGADGAEVAQLYVGGPGKEVFRPRKELKGFARVYLRAGEGKSVTIPFDDKTFRYWNTVTQRWEEEKGAYEVYVGSSVVDVRLRGVCIREGTGAKAPYDITGLGSYTEGKVQGISDEVYQKLFHTPPIRREWSGQLGKNDAICQMYYARSPLARGIYRFLTNKKDRNEAKGKIDLNVLFIYNMPFRAVAKMTHGMVGMKMVDGMVEAVNGRLFRGLWKIIGGFFSNRNGNRKYEKILAQAQAGTHREDR